MLDLLGIFPAFDSVLFGGVQASGREAWRTLASRPALRSEAFYYEDGAPKWRTLLRAAARRAPADTVLVWHSGLLKLAPFIAPSPRRLVLFLHGIEVWRKQDALTVRLMKKTNLFLSNSEHTWNRFTAFHPECAGAAHRTVHLGLGENAELPPDPPGETPAALMIGRLSRGEDYKGHREMIAVWPRVLASMPSAELRIAGDGDLRPELESMVQRLGLGERVKFYGVVTEAHKQELLRECRLLVLPSSGEGFGLVYLEAMRLGRPCIVSKLDAGAEVVNPPEAGLAVDSGEPDEVAATVVRLLAGGAEWERMAVRARRRYEANFTARHFGGRLESALFGE